MKKAIGSLAIVALFVGGAVAQEQPQREGAPAQQGERQQATRQQSAGQQGIGQQRADLDQHIAACLLLANQEEVALAKFAKEKCDSEECKEFAQTLIDAHQQAITKIEQAAPRLAAKDLVLRNTSLNQSGDAPADARTEDQAGDTADAQPNTQANDRADARTESRPAQGDDRTVARAGGQAATLDPSLMLARQIKEECLAASVTALEEKEGAEFDRCFIDQQVVAHKLMTAQLKGSEPFASAQVKPLIQQSLKTTESHLAKAEELQKKLKKDKDSD